MRRLLCLLLALALSGSLAQATEFASYHPDASGATDVSDLLQKALTDAAQGDKVLVIEPGKYLLAKPVSLNGLNGVTVASRVPHSANVHFFGPPPADGASTWPQAPAPPAEGAPRFAADLEAPAGRGLFEVSAVVYGMTWVGISFSQAYAGLLGHPRGFGGTTFRHCAFSKLQVGIWGKPIQIATFDSCSFSNVGVGILGRSPKERLDRSNLIRVYSSSFTAVKDAGIRVEGSPVNVRDCNFESCPGSALNLMDLIVGTVEGCYFEANASTLITVGPHRLPARFQGQLIVRGNQFNSNGGPALIEVLPGGRLHSYDNAVGIRTPQGQVYVAHSNEEGRVRIEDVTTWDLSQP